VRANSRIRMIAVVCLAALPAVTGGCASHRAVRCSGKLEPINAMAIVPAMNLGASESRQTNRSEVQ
jgi:hypothetical protein